MTITEMDKNEDSLKSSDTAPLAAPEDASMDITLKVEENEEEGGGGSPTIYEDRKKFLPLSKDEVMAFSKDPFWNKLRWTLFILFWIAWLLMLVASIIIIILAPKCPVPEPKEWWQRAPIYNIYIKSFKDSDGDGIGDLNGITSKVDYLKDLGVESVCLSPVFASPWKDDGRDIENFESINSMFGTMQDFKNLMRRLREKGLKIILDIIPTYTSDKHPWFLKSVNGEKDYKDFYIWKSVNNSTPPSTRMSGTSESEWSFNDQRKEWYLHQFKASEPNLNFKNPRVVKELKNVLNFWLDLGVDGFKFSLANSIKKDIKSGSPDSSTNIQDFPDVLKMLKEFREVLDIKTQEDVQNPRIMITEVETTNIYEYFGPNGTISHIPLNSGLVSIDENTVNASIIYDAVIPYISKVQKIPSAWPNFVLGDGDHMRLRSRVGSDLLSAITMIVMLLPATPITYYGDELGMVDLNFETERSVFSGRSPMVWENKEGAGFTYNSSVSPWMEILSDLSGVNAEAQVKNDTSFYSLFKTLSKLRMQDAILQGTLNMTAFENNMLAFTRVKKGNPGILVAVNFDSEEQLGDLSKMDYLSEFGMVMLTSKTGGSNKEGDNIIFKSLSLGPKEGIVASFVANVG